jgi:glycosyltransferase involved in cell wall biosynthesis
MMKFAVLLPITSRNGTLASVSDALSSFADTLNRACKTSSPKIDIEVYLGIDKGDTLLDTPEDLAKQLLESKGCIIAASLRFSPSSPPAICSMWRELAQAAYANECDFYLLMGDDVTIEHENWAVEVHKAFQQLHQELPQLPFGFGCIALNDEGAAGFPTFPILHKTHLEICPQLFPMEFVNQDADPFLFQLYRRWGASKFLDHVKVRNDIGGMQLLEDPSYVEPRYQRVHIEWKYEMLQTQVNVIQQWINGHAKGEVPRKLVFDVVTPSYRVKEEFLKRIINVRVPDNCDTMFIIVVDDPKADIEWLRKLEAKRVGKLRVRKNTSNQGASMSRNVGLGETSADWVLLLDDDVIPHDNILEAYAKAILEHGHRTDGFVGPTFLPKYPITQFGAAVHLSDISYFWDIASKRVDAPWGVTANIVVRNSPLRFDPDFIKTGGGEDIDYCLQLKKWPLLCVPEASAEHPWWSNGARVYKHFFDWARGDSLLVQKHPHLTYRNFPNVWEMTLFISLLGLFGAWPRYVTCILLIWAADIVMDVFTLMSTSEKHPIRGWRRLLAAFESNIVKNSCELGHLWIPLSSGKFFNICRRFSWFCGLDPNAVPHEIRRGARRFSVFCALCALALWM